jgi:hypothetical protein
MSHQYTFVLQYKNIPSLIIEEFEVAASSVKIAKLEAYAQIKERYKNKYPGDDAFMDRFHFALISVTHNGEVANREIRTSRGLAGPFGIEL